MIKWVGKHERGNLVPALMEVTFSGTLASQRWVSRLNYFVANNAGLLTLSAALFQGLGFGDTNGSLAGLQLDPTKVAARWLACMSSPAVMDTVRIINVYEDTDFYATPISPGLAGTGGGSVISPAMAYKLRSSVVRRDIRPGQKAIPGVDAGQIDSGGGVKSGHMVKLNDLAAALSANIEDTVGGNTVTFQPCVVGKEKYPVPNSGTPPRQAYRYWQLPATQFENLAVGMTWSAIATVRTQASRQYGRGV